MLQYMVSISYSCMLGKKAKVLFVVAQDQSEAEKKARIEFVEKHNPKLGAVEILGVSVEMVGRMWN